MASSQQGSDGEYDRQGRWQPGLTDQQGAWHAGFRDSHGDWQPGFYDNQGQWRPGYVDGADQWRPGFRSNGQWHDSSDPETLARTAALAAQARQAEPASLPPQAPPAYASPAASHSQPQHSGSSSGRKTLLVAVTSVVVTLALVAGAFLMFHLLTGDDDPVATPDDNDGSAEPEEPSEPEEPEEPPETEEPVRSAEAYCQVLQSHIDAGVPGFLQMLNAEDPEDPDSSFRDLAEVLEDASSAAPDELAEYNDAMAAAYRAMSDSGATEIHELEQDISDMNPDDAEAAEAELDRLYREQQRVIDEIEAEYPDLDAAFDQWYEFMDTQCDFPVQ